MFTKTQIEILKIFAAKITEKFSIKQIADQLKKPYPLIHRSMHALLSENFLQKDEHQLISLQYKKQHAELAYVEALKKDAFFQKNKTVSLFAKDVLEKLKEDFFILLVFGSAVEKNNPRDIDVLLIMDGKEKITNAEKLLTNIAANFTLHFDIHVITTESMREMLQKREEPNVINETLDKHVFIFGAESYYKVLTNAR
ncbi:MAG: hypothetical protein AABX98_05660 [Nanoarchaeota archaeon]